MEPRNINSTLTVISGGQTGVDRAALDVALRLHIRCGGWCPLDRLAEDGRIPAHYPLREACSPKVEVRTALNVVDSDATLILTVGTPTDGTVLTKACAERFRKPHLVLDLEQTPDVTKVKQWINSHQIQVLNVAGPRESHRPGFIHRRAFEFLCQLLSEWQEV